MESEFLVLDGGLATELIERGFHINDDPLWSARVLADDPEAIKQVHLSFLESGADVVITASYQASIEGFCEHLGTTIHGAQQLIKRSVHLAREACNEFWESHSKMTSNANKRLMKPLVAGSVGPYGACQHDGSEYTGQYADHISIEELKTWHRPRMMALVDAGVDLLAMETIPAQKEAEALAHLIQEFPYSKAWLAFSCKDSTNTVYGEELANAVMSAMSISKQIVAVGINCCAPKYVTSLLKSLQNKRISLPIVVYPNSGEEWTNHSWQSSGTLMPVGDMVPQWIDSGAKWIGGCCRSSLEDISQIRKAIRLYNNKCQDDVQHVSNERSSRYT